MRILVDFRKLEMAARFLCEGIFKLVFRDFYSHSQIQHAVSIFYMDEMDGANIAFEKLHFCIFNNN